MAIRSLTDILNSMISSIAAKIPGISTRTGTVVKDVVIDAPAQEFSNAYIEIDTAKKITSLENYNDFTTDELDSIASDYGLTRLLGTKATGAVTFRFRTLTNINIPFNTKVTTSADTNNVAVNFFTSQAISISQTNLSPYYNFVTGVHEVSVVVESENVGTANNVDAGTIVVVLSSVTNLGSITNYLAVTGGTDDESNQDLAARIQVKRAGNNKGTKLGYEDTVNADNRVIDSKVVTPNDVEMQRNEFGGSVDIYILGQELTGLIENSDWEAGILEIVLAYQPVYSVSSVSGSLTGDLVYGDDYTFDKDITVLAKSSLSQDKVVLTTAGHTKLMADGAQILTINYSYNKVIGDLQEIVDEDGNHILTSDILLRESNQVLVTVYMDITPLSGYNKTSIMNDVVTIITDNINALALNEDLQQSDLVAWAYDVTGVDKVDLSTLIPTDDVIVSKTQYLRASTITVNVI